MGRKKRKSTKDIGIDNKVKKKNCSPELEHFPTENSSEIEGTSNSNHNDESNVRPRSERNERIVKPKNDQNESNVKPKNDANENNVKREDVENESNVKNTTDLLLENRIIEDKENESYVIALLENETITICGSARLRSLHGNVCVLGYEMTPSVEPYDVYSPNSHSFLTITNTSMHYNVEETSKFDNILSHVSLMVANDIINLLKTRQCSTVIELTKLEDSCVQYITGFNNFGQLFTGSTKQRYGSNIMLDKIGVEIVVDKSVNRVRISEDFLDVRNEIVTFMLTGNNNVKMALCGGKNVGKSTLCRYMVNTLLNSMPEIGFLECDVGQTEFTPSGCISLTVVKQPLLGPPYTHIRQPYSCCFYSALTPSEDPEEYLRCVREVYTQYAEHFSDIPLVINTMGWNKGIGISLLVDTLQITEPNFVVQLDAANQYRNLPCMRAEFVINTPAWLTDLENKKKDNIDYKHLLIQSAVESQEKREKLSAPDHRTLTLLSYFSKLNVGLEAAQPYCVSWNGVSVYANGVADDHIMYALNCSVVALCHIEQEKNRDSHGAPNILKKIPRSGCLGFGVIRGIDPVKKVFYIVTPMSGDLLQSVNALVRGALEIPHQILLKQKSKSGVDVPYVGYPKDTIASTSTKPRRHMKRHFAQFPIRE